MANGALGMFRARRLLIGARGFSLVELLVVVGILSLILVSAISRLNSGYRSADSAAAELVANLRLCRAKAVSSGYHYQLGVTGPSSYSVNRMLPPTSGSDWTVDGGTPTLTVTLPGNVRFTDATGRYEFNTRGVMVVRASETFVPTKILNDSALNNSVFVQVWTSGQVN